MSKKDKIKTIGDNLFWLYANVALAHVALKNNHSEYRRLDYMVRAKLFKGLCNGTLKIGSLYDDEREKLNSDTCCYCGALGTLSLDHLISRKNGGTDSGDNLVYACKRCNSSKRERDLMEWMVSKGQFPPILILRRYLKIVIIYCESHGYMDEDVSEMKNLMLPFRIDLFPSKFPQPCDLILRFETNTM